MILYALSAFALAAAVGIYLASQVLQGRFPPWAASLTHGSLGAVGLLLLVFAVIGGERGTWLIAGLVTLALAALGGFYLASHHFRKQMAPHAVVFIHAAVAITGFCLLVAAFVGV